MNQLDFLKKHYLLIFILIFASILLSINLDKPFIGHHDWNGAWYSNFARNIMRYGLINTKFGSVENYDIVDPSEFRYFTHYPPLLPILIFISFKIFGINEQSVRLVPMIFSLGTIIMIYFLGLRFFEKKIAILAAAISGVFPIMIYFGKMPVQEILVLPLVLLSVYFYFLFFEKQNFSNFLKLIFSLLLSHLTNWPGYYVTPLFFVHFLIFSKSSQKFLIASFFPIFSIGMFILHMIHLVWLTGKPLGGGMIEVFLFRLNLLEKPIGYSNFNFLKQQVSMLVVYFTRPVLFLAMVCLTWIFWKIKNYQFIKQVQLIVILGIFGITHNLIFRNMAFIHDYMIVYLLPFFAVTAAFGFFLIINNLKFLQKWQVYLLVLAFVSLVLLERRDFVVALLASNGFSQGRELGLILNQKTKPGQKILVLSPDFKQYYEVFTEYYADRVIDYGLMSRERLLAKLQSREFRLIVAIPLRDTPQSLIDVLQQCCKMTKIDKFIIFDLNDQNTKISLGYYSHL